MQLTFGTSHVTSLSLFTFIFNHSHQLYIKHIILSHLFGVFIQAQENLAPGDFLIDEDKATSV